MSVGRGQLILAGVLLCAATPIWAINTLDRTKGGSPRRIVVPSLESLSFDAVRSGRVLGHKRKQAVLAQQYTSSMKLHQQQQGLNYSRTAVRLGRSWFLHRRNHRSLQVALSAQQTAQQALGDRAPEIWLYSLLAADYEGAALLPHFLEHYLSLGIRKDHMLFIVNHNPRRADVPEKSFQDLTRVLHDYGIDYLTWLGQYSADAHLKHKLQLLQFVPVQDWIVMVDSDEFQDYGSYTVADFLALCDRAGVNWIKGYFVDRVSANGALTPITVKPSIFEQYPLRCNIAQTLAHAEPTKIAAFKAYFRSGVGNHGLIPASVAKKYFGPAKVGEQSERYGLCGAEDLYPLTPYFRYHQHYRLNLSQHDAKLWNARGAKEKVRVHHFKWHRGVERSVRDRLQHYRGDDEQCVKGKPRFQFWKESERLMQSITSKGRVDTNETALKCRPVKPERDKTEQLEVQRM